MNVDRRGMIAGLAASLPSPLLAQGFAGLGSAAEGFATVLPGTGIVFPRDHGPHPNHRIEWWYVTANLEAADGAPYGIQWTLFRQAAAPDDGRPGWSSRQFWLAHAALTSADTHLHAEKLARGGIGQAGARAAPFTAWIDDWHLSSDGAPFSPLTVQADAETFGYRLSLATDAEMVRQGEAGYSRKSDRGQASYYVSQPFFRASGALRLGESAIPVTGSAWLDREWSSQPLAADQEGWDWFSLHLSTGEKVMLFRLRHSDGSAYLSGNWIAEDGSSEAIAAGGIRFEPVERAQVAGRSLPVRWRLSVAGRGLEIEASAINANSWNATSFPYWEGPIRFGGSHQGVGYLEMTGYPARG